jgi:hypothetical protein
MVDAADCHSVVVMTVVGSIPIATAKIRCVSREEQCLPVTEKVTGSSPVHTAKNEMWRSQVFLTSFGS